MKQTFKYILTGVSLVLVSLTSLAQEHAEGGMKTTKKVTGPDNQGLYTITLEAWATGSTTVVDNTKPADIVLVLDVSGSMDENKGSVIQVANNTAISYNTVANSEQEYFYEINGSYYKIYAETSGGRYYLRTRKWTGNGEGTAIPNNNSYSTNANGTILTTKNSGQNQVHVYTGMSRMKALKDATKVFIEEIENNDQYKVDGSERPNRLGNQIAIVKFAGNSTNNVWNGDNGTYTSSGNTYNYTQIVSNLIPVEGNVDRLKNLVDAFIARGGTQADYGMAHANTILNGVRNRDSNKTVVLFTDGEPGGQGFSNEAGYTTAENTINTSSSIKSTYTAKVFSVGLFASSPTESDDVYKYLYAVSSHYTSADASHTNHYSWWQWSSADLNITGTTNTDGIKYYRDASGDINLANIFKDIASASGGSEETIGASSQVRDYVSSSFALPIDTSNMSRDEIQAWVNQNVSVYTSAISRDGNSWGTNTTYTAAIKSLDPATQSVTITGFNFSMDDTQTGRGDGNWVGIRVPDPLDISSNFWAGKKLVIEFKILASGDATGGVGTATNTSNSGVYVPVYAEDGTTITGYDKINTFDVPHTTLAVNIKIQKSGLRKGESATFEIMRIRPRGWNENGATITEKMANVEYNAIGKPKPWTDVISEDTETKDETVGTKWYTFTKVIVTNKSEDANGDGAMMEKTIKSLDPNYVYVVREDDWGWAYDISGEGGVGIQTTSTVEVNPFKFVNQEKSGVIKHAEAVMINHFSTTAAGEARTEHYKSSKVESFGTSSTGGESQNNP